MKLNRRSLLGLGALSPFLSRVKAAPASPKAYWPLPFSYHSNAELVAETLDLARNLREGDLMRLHSYRMGFVKLDGEIVAGPRTNNILAEMRHREVRFVPYKEDDTLMFVRRAPKMQSVTFEVAEGIRFDRPTAFRGVFLVNDQGRLVVTDCYQHDGQPGGVRTCMPGLFHPRITVFRGLSFGGAPGTEALVADIRRTFGPEVANVPFIATLLKT
jgi:hypothetical protein